MQCDFPYSLDPLRGLAWQQRLAFEILQHPVSLRFDPTYVDILDHIAMSAGAQISRYEDAVLRGCLDVILQAEFDNELAY